MNEEKRKKMCGIRHCIEIKIRCSVLLLCFFSLLPLRFNENCEQSEMQRNRTGAWLHVDDGIDDVDDDGC